MAKNGLVFKKSHRAKAHLNQTPANPMPKSQQASNSVPQAPGDGTGNPTSVDPGNGLVRGNDMPDSMKGGRLMGRGCRPL